MLYQNDYIARTIKTRQMDEYIQQAQTDHLIANVNKSSSNRLIEFARGTLHALGYLLLALGHRLERATLPRPTTLGDAAPSKS